MRNTLITSDWMAETDTATFTLNSSYPILVEVTDASKESAFFRISPSV